MKANLNDVRRQCVVKCGKKFSYWWCQRGLLKMRLLKSSSAVINIIIIKSLFCNPIELGLHGTFLNTRGTLNSAKSPFASGSLGIKSDPFCQPPLPQAETRRWATAAVFALPQDGFNDARGPLSLLDVEENSTEATGFVLSRQIPFKQFDNDRLFSHFGEAACAAAAPACVEPPPTFTLATCPTLPFFSGDLQSYPRGGFCCKYAPRPDNGGHFVFHHTGSTFPLLAILKACLGFVCRRLNVSV